MFAEDQELKFVVGTRDKFPWCLKVLYNLFRFRKHFAQKNPPRISRILRTQEFVWHPYKDVRFGIFRRLIQLVLGYTHGTSTIREECTAYGSTERVAELFKRLLQKIFAQSRSATKRETSKDEASGTLSTVPTNNCQHRKTLFYMYITESSSRLSSAWLSTRLGSARLVSSHHIASRLV